MSKIRQTDQHEVLLSNKKVLNLSSSVSTNQEIPYFLSVHHVMGHVDHAVQDLEKLHHAT